MEPMDSAVNRDEHKRGDPETGPRLLFFSGGSAISGLACALKHYTHNSIHLVTPFDSGGSSASLREAFNMPAVGDLRARLMALADERSSAHPALYRLLTHRLSKEATQPALRNQLEQMALADEPLTRNLAKPAQGLVCHYLKTFLAEVPVDFDFRGASIGNLVLTGGYLHDKRNLVPITLLLTELLDIRGIVTLITQQVSQLRVNTVSGRVVVGQHLITGKETLPLGERITEIELQHPPGRVVTLRPAERDLINTADLIVFPPGSFFTSIIANLLPEGVGRAVLSSSAPKVFVPNLGKDPELEGISLREQIEILHSYLQRDAKSSTAGGIDIVLTDSKLQRQVDPEFRAYLLGQGIELVDCDLVDPDRADRYDDTKLCEALLSLS